MRKLVIGALTTIAIGIFQSVVVASILPKDTAARIEAIPVQTLTISDQQFLKGDRSGRPTTIAGSLRINTDLWRRQFESLGISTFALDSFSGRGIVSTVVDQSQLGRLNVILDLYRSLAVLAGHPRIDPNRIAVMGFSRGGQAALYGTLKRFHKLWNPTGIDPAAYIALYPPCNTTYIGDTDVTDHPVQIFHGTLDDYVEAAPCRAYVKRLKQTAAQIQLTEYPDAWHAFDYPWLQPTPIVAWNAQTTHCVLKEEPLGTIINTATHRPFTYEDDCVGRNPHLAYSANATHATEEAVKGLLRRVFRLD